jgi:plastocyanin
MKFVRIAALCAAVPVLGLAAAGCGGGDGGGGDARTATSPAATSTAGAPAATEPASSPTTGAPAATATIAAPATAQTTSAGEVAVTAADLSFTPATFVISRGVDITVTMTNSGALAHTINVYRDQAYSNAVADTGTISGGGTGELTLTSTDTGDATQLFFRCNIHRQEMQGTISVE